MSDLALIPKRYSVERTAKMMGRSPKMIYKLVERGDLGHFKVAGRVEVGDTHIREFFARCERPAKVAA